METTEPRSLLRGILRTEKGQVMHMRYLPDGEQMKSADAYTIEKIGIPSLDGAGGAQSRGGSL